MIINEKQIAKLADSLEQNIVIESTLMAKMDVLKRDIALVRVPIKNISEVLYEITGNEFYYKTATRRID